MLIFFLPNCKFIYSAEIFMNTEMTRSVAKQNYVPVISKNSTWKQCACMCTCLLTWMCITRRGQNEGLDHLDLKVVGGRQLSRVHADSHTTPSVRAARALSYQALSRRLFSFLINTCFLGYEPSSPQSNTFYTHFYLPQSAAVWIMCTNPNYLLAICLIWLIHG